MQVIIFKNISGIIVVAQKNCFLALMVEASRVSCFSFGQVPPLHHSACRVSGVYREEIVIQ